MSSNIPTPETPEDPDSQIMNKQNVRGSVQTRDPLFSIGRMPHYFKFSDFNIDGEFRRNDIVGDVISTTGNLRDLIASRCTSNSFKVEAFTKFIKRLAEHEINNDEVNSALADVFADFIETAVIFPGMMSNLSKGEDLLNQELLLQVLEKMAKDLCLLLSAHATGNTAARESALLMIYSIARLACTALNTISEEHPETASKIARSCDVWPMALGHRKADREEAAQKTKELQLMQDLVETKGKKADLNLPVNQLAYRILEYFRTVRKIHPLPGQSDDSVFDIPEEFLNKIRRLPEFNDSKPTINAWVDLTYNYLAFLTDDKLDSIPGLKDAADTRVRSLAPDLIEEADLLSEEIMDCKNQAIECQKQLDNLAKKIADPNELAKGRKLQLDIQTRNIAETEKQLKKRKKETDKKMKKEKRQGVLNALRASFKSVCKLVAKSSD